MPFSRGHVSFPGGHVPFSSAYVSFYDGHMPFLGTGRDPAVILCQEPNFRKVPDVFFIADLESIENYEYKIHAIHNCKKD